MHAPTRTCTPTVAVLDAGGSRAAVTAAAARIARDHHVRPSIGKASRDADGVGVWLDDTQFEALRPTRW